MQNQDIILPEKVADLLQYYYLEYSKSIDKSTRMTSSEFYIYNFVKKMMLTQMLDYFYFKNAMFKTNPDDKTNYYYGFQSLIKKGYLECFLVEKTNLKAYRINLHNL